MQSGIARRLRVHASRRVQSHERTIREPERYLHLVRHPYAAIDSGVQLQRDIMGNLNTTWDGVEQAWIDSNLGTRDFLLAVETAAKLILRCEPSTTFMPMPTPMPMLCATLQPMRLFAFPLALQVRGPGA